MICVVTDSGAALHAAGCVVVVAVSLPGAKRASPIGALANGCEHEIYVFCTLRDD